MSHTQPISAYRPRLSDEICRRFINETSGSPWNNVASDEVWLAQPETLAPSAVMLCSIASEPPLLDGEFHDLCWQRASPVRLRNEAEHRQTRQPFAEGDELPPGANVRLAYDARFLYVAAEVPRDSELPSDPPHLPGRTHDADLADFDRLNFSFDVDRDYATHYQIDVDQRGWTTDACWENRGWNCQRYIAAVTDEKHWRIEMAIPFSELVAHSPASGDTWGTAIARVMPTIGVESWTLPCGSRPRAEGFGLLRFE